MLKNNSSRSDMLGNGVWWLGRVEFLPESFMPESFKLLICSIRVSTVACRMALHDMPNPHLVDQENCLAQEMKSQTRHTYRVSRRFPSRSYRLHFFRIKNTVCNIYIILPEKGWNESQRLLFDSRGGAWNSTSSIWHGSNMKRPNINNCYRVIIFQSLNGPF